MPLQGNKQELIEAENILNSVSINPMQSYAYH